jgi:heme/copper-type cytochrome/quinol oxidase subunit 2
VNIILIILGTIGLTFVGFGIFEHFPMFPVSAASEAVIVDHAFQNMLNLTIPIFALVSSVLLLILFRHRQSKDRPKEEGESFDSSRGRLVEVVVLLLVVGWRRIQKV